MSDNNIPSSVRPKALSAATDLLARRERLQSLAAKRVRPSESNADRTPARDSETRPLHAVVEDLQKAAQRYHPELAFSVDETIAMSPEAMDALSPDALDEALEQLERAMALEPERVRMWVETDRMFDGLKEDATFAQLVD